MKMNKIILSCVTILGLGTVSVNAISLEFIKRGFKSCTDNCSVGKIKCDGKASQTGSLEWCKDKCVYPDKTNAEDILNGIDSCRGQVNISSAPVPAAALKVSEDTILNKLSKGQDLSDPEVEYARGLWNKEGTATEKQQEILARLPIKYMGTKFNAFDALGR